MKQVIPTEFIKTIPKADLHLHLDGSLRLASFIELARSSGVKLPSYDEAFLRKTVFKNRYRDLPDYLQGFRYTCAVLQNEENLERTAFELAEDCIAEGVRYIEVRFAPHLHIRDGLSCEQVLQSVARGLDHAARTHNRSHPVRSGEDIPFHAGLIVCALRKFSKEMGPYFSSLLSGLSFTPEKQVYSAASLDLARAAVETRDKTGLPLVGFDLAGEEYGYPSTDHKEAYAYANRHFLKTTVHAGEAAGPLSVFQAVYDCQASRIGHGTFLFDTKRIQDPSITNPDRFVRQLVDAIGAGGIPIEVCLTSNRQTLPNLSRIADHPVGRMLEYRLPVTLCTDNRLISNTTVTNEMQQLVDHFPVTEAQFRQIVYTGFAGSFFPGSFREKQEYLCRVMERYESLARIWKRTEASS